MHKIEERAEIDSRLLRNCLGMFATGVTVVTTCDSIGRPVGVTVNSFNSVSLDPPLVLWSQKATALSRTTFRTSGHFAINILSSHDSELSNRFAKAGSEKFGGVRWEHGRLGSPILDGAIAAVECQLFAEYSAGDHVIVLGRVIRLAFQEDGDPLLFYQGRYHRLAQVA